ncbi:MAG: hypothetical protein ACM32E_06100 [Gemmatimonadota bacterium]
MPAGGLPGRAAGAAGPASPGASSPGRVCRTAACSAAMKAAVAGDRVDGTDITRIGSSARRYCN